jgi:ketosteroid isomerase-like protein
VEIVRATIEVWNAGDMDTLRELYDPDVILRMPEDWPEPGPYVGREAVMRHWEQQREAFDADTVEPISDFIDTADHVRRQLGHMPADFVDSDHPVSPAFRRVVPRAWEDTFSRFRFR